ncbi:unnamed protein product [Ectocarpus sp. 6 AP-2014]
MGRALFSTGGFSGTCSCVVGVSIPDGCCIAEMGAIAKGGGAGITEGDCITDVEALGNIAWPPSACSSGFSSERGSIVGTRESTFSPTSSWRLFVGFFFGKRAVVSGTTSSSRFDGLLCKILYPTIEADISTSSESIF